MRAIVWTLVLLGFAACGAPIRVTRVSGPAAYRSITANALSSDRASEWTRNTANEWGLLDRFDQQPEAALAALREIVTSRRGGSRELFALAELSFLHAERTGKQPYHLAAAVYAYAYLFPAHAGDLPNPFDPRSRLAIDIYNRAITTAFASRDGRTVELAPGTYPLPFGEIEVTLNPAQLDWGDRRLVDFTPVAELELSGMRNRHRIPGLGAALIARAIPREDVDVQTSLIAPRAEVAATALLRLPEVHEGIVTGRLRGALELYTPDQTEVVTVEGRAVPLEIDETTPLALQLAGSPIWKQETAGFFGRDELSVPLPFLVSRKPHRPGLIPVVFVHGTDSSWARWADMENDLLADPWIRQRFQFWNFQYESGNPIWYSGMGLRDKLTAAMERMDREGRDGCLREMVVIGHSQGGLLTKLTAVDSGDKLWNAVVRVPPDQVPGSETFRTMMRKALIVEPLPFVRRLVFISTPHRGSFLTGRWIDSLLGYLVQLPAELTSASAEDANVFYSMVTKGRLSTALDNMTRGDRFLEALTGIPVAAGVPYHSIISVEEKFPVIADGNDGVVEYRSAHRDDAASELVVRSPHSCQSHPNTIQEVRRILHLHGESLEAAGMQCGPADSGPTVAGSKRSLETPPDGGGRGTDRR
ncbi:MAG: esterase/lipase family protein [Nitrospiraceae bacterium]